MFSSIHGDFKVSEWVSWPNIEISIENMQLLVWCIHSVQLLVIHLNYWVWALTETRFLFEVSSHRFYIHQAINNVCLRENELVDRLTSKYYNLIPLRYTKSTDRTCSKERCIFYFKWFPVSFGDWGTIGLLANKLRVKLLWCSRVQILN